MEPSAHFIIIQSAHEFARCLGYDKDGMICDFQNAFVRLCADHEFRASFLSDPHKTLSGFDLTAKERNALLQIPQDSLKRFANSLIAKRTHEFLKVIPVTLKVAPAVERRFRDWISRHPAPRKATVLDPGQEDALRALDDLSFEIAKDPREGLYCADLFAFEIFHSCSSKDRIVRQLRSRFRIDLLFLDVRKGLIPIDPGESLTLFYFQADRWTSTALF